jgi:hypothetical protein
MTRRKDPAATRTSVSEMEAAGHPLPAFEPVPRKFRHDGWTPERQKAFIAALAESGNVTAACAHVGMTTEGAYYLRRQPGAESFARAWQGALDGGIAPPDQPLAPVPLTLRGLMHILEAQARRQREAAEPSGLSDAELEDINAAIIEDFAPVR